MKLTNFLDFAKNEARNLVLHVLGAAPSTPATGQVWFNSADDRPEVQTAGGAKKVLLVGDVTGGGGDAATLDGQDGTYYLARANHTGQQAASTISDFAAAVDARVALVVDAAPAALDTLNELAAALGDDANFAATVNTALAARTQKFSADLGNGAATSFVVTHNLGSRDLVATVREAASPYAVVLADVEMTSATQATVRFALAPSAGQYRITLVG